MERSKFGGCTMSTDIRGAAEEVLGAAEEVLGAAEGIDVEATLVGSQSVGIISSFSISSSELVSTVVGKVVARPLRGVRDLPDRVETMWSWRRENNVGLFGKK